MPRKVLDAINLFKSPDLLCRPCLVRLWGVATGGRINETLFGIERVFRPVLLEKLVLSEDGGWIGDVARWDALAHADDRAKDIVFVRPRETGKCPVLLRTGDSRDALGDIDVLKVIAVSVLWEFGVWVGGLSIVVCHINRQGGVSNNLASVPRNALESEDSIRRVGDGTVKHKAAAEVGGGHSLWNGHIVNRISGEDGLLLSSLRRVEVEGFKGCSVVATVEA